MLSISGYTVIMKTLISLVFISKLVKRYPNQGWHHACLKTAFLKKPREDYTYKKNNDNGSH